MIYEIFLGIVKVFALMAQSSSKFVHDLLEDHAVNVLPQHVEQEPVPHLALLHQRVHHLSLYQSESDVKEVGSHPR